MYRACKPLAQPFNRLYMGLVLSLCERKTACAVAFRALLASGKKT